MAILHVNVTTSAKNRLISKFPHKKMWTVLNYLMCTCTKQGGAINLVHVSLYSKKMYSKKMYSKQMCNVYTYRVCYIQHA